MATPCDEEDISDRMRGQLRQLGEKFFAAETISKKYRDFRVPVKAQEPIIEKKTAEASLAWADLIRMAEQGEETPFPQFTEKAAVYFAASPPGFALAALHKCLKNLSEQTGLSKNEALAEVYKRLDAQMSAKQSGASLIKFLRDADPDWFSICPVCGAENEPGWESCAECKTENY